MPILKESAFDCGSNATSFVLLSMRRIERALPSPLQARLLEPSQRDRAPPPTSIPPETHVISDDYGVFSANPIPIDLGKCAQANVQDVSPTLCGGKKLERQDPGRIGVRRLTSHK